MKKILNHSHTGRLREHRHTSYGSLLFLLVVPCLVLLTIGRPVAADNQSYEPRSLSVSAVVPSPVPLVAPTITNISNNQSFASATTIEIQGLCPKHTITELFTNQVMAGSAACLTGTYSIPIELFIGSNQLLARAYNADGIPGPDSTTYTVELSQPSSQSAPSSSVSGANQFVVAVRAAGSISGQHNETISWPLVVGGGIPPYIIAVSWGDGQSSTYVENSPGNFQISHTYGSSGSAKASYPITVRANDQYGSDSFLQLVANLSARNSGTVVASGSFVVPLLWMILLMCLLIIASFWIGERRALRHQRRRLALA